MKAVTAGQLCVVFEKLMPEELELRGMDNAVAACNAVIDDLVNSPTPSEAAAATDPDAIFQRLAGG